MLTHGRRPAEPGVVSMIPRGNVSAHIVACRRLFAAEIGAILSSHTSTHISLPVSARGPIDQPAVLDNAGPQARHGRWARALTSEARLRGHNSTGERRRVLPGRNAALASARAATT